MTTLDQTKTISKPIQISDFVWRRIKKTEENLIENHLIPYAEDKLASEAIGTAFSSFFPEWLALDEDLDPNLVGYFFTPWSLFDWIPGDEFNCLDKDFDPEMTIAENYYSNHLENLSNIERRFIFEVSQTFYSFYKVLEIKKDKALLIVEDLMLERINHVKVKYIAKELLPDDIIFSRILTMDKQSVFVGMAPYSIPQIYAEAIAFFRESLALEAYKNKLTPQALRFQFSTELMDVFFEIFEKTNRQPHQGLLNTDGDDIEYSISHFKLKISVEETLNSLLHLANTKSPEPFLDSAVFDNDGYIMQIKLPWVESTIIGQITLNTGHLILQTDSVKRANNCKKILSKLLGKNISFIKTELDLT